MYVMTVDQHASRRGKDAVPDLLRALDAGYSDRVVLAFERTAGDEVQALLDAAEAVVDIGVELLRRRLWSIGIGIGPVDGPMPDSARAGRGAAYVHARAAVERAKSAPHRICVEGDPAEATAHTESACWLLANVLERRSKAGWEAVDAMQMQTHQADAARSLHISPQAMSRRLAVAGWTEERRGRDLAAYLLGEVS